MGTQGDKYWRPAPVKKKKGGGGQRLLNFRGGGLFQAMEGKGTAKRKGGKKKKKFS